MDKVISTNYYIPSTSHMNVPQGLGSLERSSMVRGHHSGISKAVDAHRQLVEERQTRNVRRDFNAMATADAQPSAELFVAQQIAADDTVTQSEPVDLFENTLIEPPGTQAKMASIQMFQTLEPDRPTLGEPIPKGSYLDIEA